MRSIQDVAQGSFKNHRGRIAQYWTRVKIHLGSRGFIGIALPMWISDQPGLIVEGNHYSNGIYGENWSVRNVIALSGNTPNALVTYQVVEGDGSGSSANCTTAEFTEWQRYEVIHDRGAWHRIVRSFPVNGEVRRSGFNPTSKLKAVRPDNQRLGWRRLPA